MTLKLYLDTEFNSHGGELISIALAGSDDSKFYAVAPLPEPIKIHPWVSENVIPKLYREPEHIELLRKRLQEYLLSREGCEIYADWPADFQHLMELMCGPHYADSFMIDCSMILLRSTEPKSEIPHNAIHDAVALRDWHQSTGLQKRKKG
ncbi:hypothetical protein [Roseibium sp.]|uniref:hypothetical protein n=1 Tax=Roseibium sp. TaxID=1936156 RepID=UPI003B52C3E2